MSKPDLNTAEFFKGNPYLEAFAPHIDGVLNSDEKVNHRVETALRLAELYEQRTTNMLAYQDAGSGTTTRAFKEELRQRVGSEKPKSSRPTVRAH